MDRCRTAVLLLALTCTGATATLAVEPGDCPPTDLSVVLNTGWDQSTGGTPIPYGDPDDDWAVADVITAHPAWLTLPDSEWIALNKYGPNGTYVYEMCWCLDDSFLNAVLDFDIRADDQADIFLNGVLIGSTPNGSFNDPVPTSVTVTDPMAFTVGENCLEVHADNIYGVVNGFNLAGTMTADDGLCCGCDADDVNDDASTGTDDPTGGATPTGSTDDEWVVTVAPSGPLPRPADVIDTFQTWDRIPGTKWVTADQTGQNGTYVYEKCWTLNAAYHNATVDIELLADNQASVFLNGNLLGSTPQQQAWRFPSTVLFTGNRSFFRGGENCLTVEVQNTNQGPTGFDASVVITVPDGEPCPCFELPTDAEAWWPLDETTGPTAFEPLNAHNGTHTELGGPSGPPPTPAPGYVDGALEFDGVNDYVRVPDDPGLDFDALDDLTIDAWINTDNTQREPIVHKADRDFNDPGYEFSVSAGFLSMQMADGTGTIVCIGSGGLDDSAWHFVAVTVDRDDPAGLRLYIDGVLDTVCDPTSIGSMVNDVVLGIGARPFFHPGQEAFWRGRLDEIEIFRRALTETEIQGIYLAGHSGKCKTGPCEDAFGVPVCNGECPVGEVCLDSLGPNHCECVPETTACGGTVCDGPCPDPDDVCVDNGITCGCEPADLCEGMSTHPECDGVCPDSDWMCSNNGQRCHCEPPDVPCEESLHPTCAGVCPVTGVECIPHPDPLVFDCICPSDDPPQCEGFETFPACDGECPPGQECWNNGQRCHCIDPPHCGDPGDYPTCNLPCPDGYTCEALGPPVDICECVEDVVLCSDTFYPACDGDCPAGQTCENIVGTDECECVSEPVACGNELYPACNGVCPANEKCVESPGQGCWCQLCKDDPPDDPFIPWVNMDTGGKIRWTSMTCAHFYNVYRLTAPTLRDLDDDGLADDYGDCYQDDIIGNETTDGTKPPPGSTHWYLVTGENFAGESSLGTNSSAQVRQATTVCP